MREASHIWKHGIQVELQSAIVLYDYNPVIPILESRPFIRA